MVKVDLEKRALRVSIVGALIMAGLGLYFAFAAHSEAILLDGVFSGIGFVMASLTLKVAILVKRPDDEHFHFGYSHFAPLLNVVKSMLLLLLCSIAFISAILAILDGGRSMAVDSAVAYGTLSTAGCLIIAAYIHRAAGQSGSTLVAVDAQTWIMDSMMSGAVLAAFVTGWAIQDTSLGVYMDYLDPGLVAILCLLSLPMPLGTLRRNLREVLLFAPDPEISHTVERHLLAVMPGTPKENYRIRLLKMGNSLNVLIHVYPGPNFELTSLQRLDEIRVQFQTTLSEMDGSVVADLVFVGDMALSE